MATADTSPPKPGRWKSFFIKLGDTASNMVNEIVGTAIAVAGIALIDFLLQWWVGEDRKFFDVIPIRWGFDAAHLCVVGRLIYRILFPEKAK
jgi:hypothetical protein